MINQEKDPASPATTRLAYDAMQTTWDKVQTVLDGTQAMRGAGEAYLPRHEGESDVSYRERLSRATLFNMTKLTLTNWVGKPFGAPIGFDLVPPAIEPLLDNVDLVGNDVHVFCRDWFSDGIAKSYSHVLVDYPRTAPTGDDGRPRTLADDQTEGARPYWVHIRPENLIFADAEMVGGRETLREVRILERVTERNGFAEQCVVQIRQITTNPIPGRGCIVTLYRPNPEKKGDKIEWLVYDPPYEMTLTRIPLVTFYSDRNAFMLGTSPIADLADLNIAHWQSGSDQRACLTVARFPILALSGGVDKDKQLTVGPNQWLWSPDPQGKFYYVEHTGAALASGDNDMANLENQMSEYGAQFLKKRPGNTTATARALDSAEATSPLQDMVVRFGFALNQALALTAEWLRLPKGGTATLCTDFAPTAADAAMLTTLRELRKARDISRLAYIDQLKEWGVLNENYDADKDALQLEKESMDLFNMPTLPDPEPDPEPGSNNDDEDPADRQAEEE